MSHELEMGIVEQVKDIVFAARKKIIDAKHIVTISQQALTEMGAEKTRATLGWSPEVNRKLVHILTGLLVFFTPFFFNSNKPLIWMAIIFIIVNSIAPLFLFPP